MMRMTPAGAAAVIAGCSHFAVVGVGRAVIQRRIGWSYGMGQMVPNGLVRQEAEAVVYTNSS